MAAAGDAQQLAEAAVLASADFLCVLGPHDDEDDEDDSSDVDVRAPRFGDDLERELAEMPEAAQAQYRRMARDFAARLAAVECAHGSDAGVACRSVDELDAKERAYRRALAAVCDALRASAEEAQRRARLHKARCGAARRSGRTTTTQLAAAIVEQKHSAVVTSLLVDRQGAAHMERMLRAWHARAIASYTWHRYVRAALATSGGAGKGNGGESGIDPWRVLRWARAVRADLAPLIDAGRVHADDVHYALHTLLECTRSPVINGAHIGVSLDAIAGDAMRVRNMLRFLAALECVRCCGGTGKDDDDGGGKGDAGARDVYERCLRFVVVLRCIDDLRGAMRANNDDKADATLAAKQRAQLCALVRGADAISRTLGGTPSAETVPARIDALRRYIDARMVLDVRTGHNGGECDAQLPLVGHDATAATLCDAMLARLRTAYANAACAVDAAA